MSTQSLSSLPATPAEASQGASPGVPTGSSGSAVWLPTILGRKGGPWLGAARGWMQTRFKNGEDVTWGSNDRLFGAPVTVRDIEELAAIVAAAALNNPPNNPVSHEGR